MEEVLKNCGVPLCVVAVALLDDAGRALMQQRKTGSEHGGLWEFPGGKLDHGEGPEQAAVRELAEELGVSIPQSALRSVSFASGYTVPLEEGGKGPKRPLILLLYACSAWEGEPRALEAMECAWVPVGEIAKLSMPPLDYPLAEALSAYLSTGK